MSARGGRRPGAGRPRELEAPVTLSVQVDGAVARRLARHCQTLHVTISEAIRAAVAEWLARAAADSPPRRGDGGRSKRDSSSGTGGTAKAP